ncbi:hypothetical protein LMG24238_03244 [Paraburkholderia sediminicola]|uniref:Antitoxin Xre/MbcA/ParS-like toxin-binding domain-containing protein n=1 Tax=Paraburkholderia sediminicola TaxID=458836 RepID=A0A6J5B7S2_9BURK|nr:hypothetical protein [Paraburkholderia sediminicola]CAB3693597.1 hypothetical protein LMG24238_03244 [Paraburkholderia sediminicola]
MSSLDFVEITSRGEIPFVAMGHVNVQEVVAAEPPRGARLRVFSHRLPGQPSVSFSLACVFISIVRHMASPDSEVRNYLTHSDCDIARGKHLLFFRAKAGGTERVEPMAVCNWSDVGSLWGDSFDRALWIAVEGPHRDVLKLLDSIREQEQDCTPVSAEASPPAADDAHQAAIDFRNKLLAKNWPDGKRVAEIAGSGSASNPHQYATRLRSNGALLGVWVAAERTYRHPDFQFDAHGTIRPDVASLLKVLPSNGEDPNGWRRAFWLYSPHAMLDGETPAAVFARAPQQVVEVAKREFCEDPSAHW